jgi:hypothetical protein
MPISKKQVSSDKRHAWGVMIKVRFIPFRRLMGQDKKYRDMGKPGLRAYSRRGRRGKGIVIWDCYLKSVIYVTI